MPRTADQCTQTGIYVATCCTHRIFICKDVDFPRCPHEPTDNVEWLLSVAMNGHEYDGNNKRIYLWRSLTEDR